MKRHSAIHSVLGKILCGLSLSCLIVSGPLALAQTSKAAKKSAGDKKSAYMGDPARKRGLEIGFDLGLQAGREDKKNDAKPMPQEKEAYKKPEKYYRHEFGSQANFVSAFKGGFLNGYQQAFGKKVTIKPDGTAVGGSIVPGSSTPIAKKPKGAPPPPANPAADAL